MGNKDQEREFTPIEDELFGNAALPNHVTPNYLRFDTHTELGRVTSITTVFNLNTAQPIAHIKWHGAWRKYCLFPFHSTIWDQNCLIEVHAKLELLNNEHAQRIVDRVNAANRLKRLERLKGENR